MKKLIMLTIILITHFSAASNISITNEVEKDKKKVTQIDEEITSETDATKGFNGKFIISNDNNTNEINKTNWSKWLISIVTTVFLAVLAGLVTLAQVKVNNISKAIINWCENLREIISKYISEVRNLNYGLRILIEDKNYLLSNEKKKELEEKYNELMKDSKKICEFGNKIKLYLNNKQNKLHKKLNELIDIYEKKAVENIKEIERVDDINDIEHAIIKISQEILNETWEEAKAFGLTDIFKFHRNKKSNI